MLDDNLYDIVTIETEWVVIVDIDEFMYGKNGFTIKSYLTNIPNDIGCIYVIWNIINPPKDCNGNLLNHNTIKNNNKRLNYDKFNELSWFIQNANHFGKSIIRTSMLLDNEKFWIHKTKVSRKTLINYGFLNDNEYDNADKIEFSEYAFEKINITLNHYVIRNLDDYIKKEKQLNIEYRRPFLNGLFEMLELDDSFFIKDDYITKLL